MEHTSKSKVRAPREPDGFDVTCVVGRVAFSTNGDAPSAHVAAFTIIAELDQQGTYTFPLSNGETCEVQVNYRAT